MRLVILFFAFFQTVICQAAGVQIGRTRIIYESTAKEVALTLVNKEQELPWLVQSWTDTGDEKTRGPFIITPPLFRLDPQKEQSLRITWNGAPLPEDKESLFYLNVRTIPATDKAAEHKNVLKLIYKTRLKLFWRPKGLKSTAAKNCQSLRFSLTGDRLKVSNDGDYHIIFDSLKLGNSLIREADMVAPKATITLPVSPHPGASSVKWRCITDYGNASEENTASLSQG